MFHSMFGYMRLMISRLSILPSAAYNEDVMPMVLPCVWCPQRTRTTMIEVTNGVCRVLTCFIFTGLSTLPFESCSLLLFESVIYPLSLIFACYFVRTICAEDKDTIPPIGFQGRAEHTAWTGACLLFALEQISGFFQCAYSFCIYLNRSKCVTY